MCSDEYQYSETPMKCEAEKSMGGTWTPFIKQGVSGHGMFLFRSDEVFLRHCSKEPVPTSLCFSCM